MKNIFLLLISIPFFIGCNKDDDNIEEPTVNFTFKYTHNWDEDPFTHDNFGSLDYTNENGEVLGITKMRYLVSNFIFHRANADDVYIPGYQLIDLSKPETLEFIPFLGVPVGNYTGVSFAFGLSGPYNINGQYPDLNALSWSWPLNLGGGYHFMQMEGFYEGEEGISPFALHHGTAKVSEGEFLQNYFVVQLDGFTLKENNTIEVKVDLSEWFKNPNTWDLNEYDIDLMGNYDAQIMLRENGKTAFSLGNVGE